MTKEKQIEEMARIICENTAISCYETAVEIAEELTAKDYRKSSEVAREIIEEIEQNFEIGYGGVFEFMQEMKECGEPCACAWYIDNVACGDKSVEDCTAFKETKYTEGEG